MMVRKRGFWGGEGLIGSCGVAYGASSARLCGVGGMERLDKLEGFSDLSCFREPGDCKVVCA